MIFGWPERSTYHTTCVNRVKSHLKRTCSEAGKEKGFVPGRITDAWGYDRKTKTLYFCEIKVNQSDLLKAVSQIHDTAFKFKPQDSQNRVMPVIAIPKKLCEYLAKNDIGQWQSFRSLCKTLNIAVWLIEQSNVRQIQGPKPRLPVKAKVKTKINVHKSRKSAIKVKKNAKRKTTTKVKSSGLEKTDAKPKVTTKPKTTTKSKLKNRTRKSTIKARAVTTENKKTKRIRRKS